MTERTASGLALSGWRATTLSLGGYHVARRRRLALGQAMIVGGGREVLRAVGQGLPLKFAEGPLTV